MQSDFFCVCLCIYSWATDGCADVGKINKYLIFTKNGMFFGVRWRVLWELAAFESIKMVYGDGEPESITM